MIGMRRNKSEPEREANSPSTLSGLGGYGATSANSSPGVPSSVKRALSLQAQPTDIASRSFSDQPPVILRAELQINVPVEGVELEPYILVMNPNGQSRQVFDDDDGVIFKWSRCEYTASRDAHDGPRTCIMTGRAATMQCILPDVSFLIDGQEYSHDQAYFASADEFLKAWPYHVRNRCDGEVSRPRRQDPSRDFVNVWQEVSDRRVYVPGRKDVGRILKLEVTPFSLSSQVVGKSMVIETAEVLVAPPPAPPRGSIEVPGPPGSFDPRPKVVFKVLSYNCLADIYATPQVYPYTQPWALAWNYRKRNLVREILSYKADILALQEVQCDHWRDYLDAEFRKHGYDGVYKQKTRESMGQDGKMDGCAILYRRNKFTLVEKHALEFNNVALTRKATLRSEKALQSLLKDNVALVLVLEATGPGGGAGSRVCVATTHIYQNQGAPHVKMWQVMTLVRELDKFTSNGQRFPLVLTGDLNSLHDSAVYEYLEQGGVSSQHPDLADDTLGILDTAELRHGLQLRDAHSMLGTGICTNYTSSFSGVLDYVWYTKERLRVTRVMEQVDRATLTAHTALPNPQYSSDHIALMCEFELAVAR